MPPANIAILASGSGSNAEALMDHFGRQASDVGRVVWVCSNRREAGVLERAERWGIPHTHMTKADMMAGRLLEAFRARDVHWVALAGFLLKVPADVCHAFEGRMLNIHPALLPNHGGAGMYGMHVHRAVKAAGDAVSGMTIHWVNERYDEGDIVFQGEVDLTSDDSPETIAAKVLALEHRHYPKVLEGLIRLAQGSLVRDGSHLKSLKP